MDSLLVLIIAVILYLIWHNYKALTRILGKQRSYQSDYVISDSPYYDFPYGYGYNYPYGYGYSYGRRGRPWRRRWRGRGGGRRWGGGGRRGGGRRGRR